MLTTFNDPSAQVYNTNQMTSYYFDRLVMTTQAHAEAELVSRYELKCQFIELVLPIIFYVPQCLCFGIPRYVYYITLRERPVVVEGIHRTNGVVPAVAIIRNDVSPMSCGSRIKIEGSCLSYLLVADSYGNPRGQPHDFDGDALALETFFISFEGWVDERKISVIVVLLDYHFVAVGYCMAGMFTTITKHVRNLRLGLCVHIDRKYVLQFIIRTQCLLEFSVFGAQLLQQLLDRQLIVGELAVFLLLMLFVLKEKLNQICRNNLLEIGFGHYLLEGED